MNLVGLLPCRNESWVLGLSARVALMWCDSLIILNHASTDQSPQIIADLITEFGARVRVLYVHDTQWDEMPHRNMMLNHARQHGATHVSMIDADELLTGNLLGSIREHIAGLPPGAMLTLPLYNLRRGLDRYHLSGIWGNRTVSVAFRDVNTAAWRGDKQHHREPEGVQWTRRNYGIQQGDGGIMHLWGASERRLIAKHALYKVNEVLKPAEKRDYKTVEEIDRAFSWAIKGDPQNPRYGTPETWTYAETPREWWKPYIGVGLGTFQPTAKPWQEEQVRRLVAQHGRERFQGLDLFGIA